MSQTASPALRRKTPPTDPQHQQASEEGGFTTPRLFPSILDIRPSELNLDPALIAAAHRTDETNQSNYTVDAEAGSLVAPTHLIKQRSPLSTITTTATDAFTSEAEKQDVFGSMESAQLLSHDPRLAYEEAHLDRAIEQQLSRASSGELVPSQDLLEEEDLVEVQNYQEEFKGLAPVPLIDDAHPLADPSSSTASLSRLPHDTDRNSVNDTDNTAYDNRYAENANDDTADIDNHDVNYDTNDNYDTENENTQYDDYENDDIDQNNDDTDYDNDVVSNNIALDFSNRKLKLSAQSADTLLNIEPEGQDEHVHIEEREEEDEQTEGFVQDLRSSGDSLLHRSLDMIPRRTEPTHSYRDRYATTDTQEDDDHEASASEARNPEMFLDDENAFLPSSPLGDSLANIFALAQEVAQSEMDEFKAHLSSKALPELPRSTQESSTEQRYTGAMFDDGVDDILSAAISTDLLASVEPIDDKDDDAALYDMVMATPKKQVEQVNQQTNQGNQQSVDPETMFRKVEAIKWLRSLLEKTGKRWITNGTTEDSMQRIDLFELLRNGHGLCHALNTLMWESPRFKAKHLSLIDVREQSEDSFEWIVNLTNFVRTVEMFYEIDKTLLFDPVHLLRSRDERILVDTLLLLKKVAQKDDSETEHGLATTETQSRMATHMERLIGLLEKLPSRTDSLLSAKTKASMLKLFSSRESLSGKPTMRESRSDSKPHLSSLTQINEQKDAPEEATTASEALTDHATQDITASHIPDNELKPDASHIKEVGITTTDNQGARKETESELNAEQPAIAILHDDSTYLTILSRLDTMEAFQTGLMSVLQNVNDKVTKLAGSQTEVLDRVQFLNSTMSTTLSQIHESVRSIKIPPAVAAIQDVPIKTGRQASKKLNDLEEIAAIHTEAQASRRRSSISQSNAPVDRRLSETSPKPEKQDPNEQKSSSLTADAGKTVQGRESAQSSAPSTHRKSVSKVQSPFLQQQQEPAQQPTPFSKPATLTNQGSMPKVFKLPEAILKLNLPKDEIFRQSVIYELIESEADYVRDLNLMTQRHYPELKAKGLLTQEELRTMFSNAENLLPINQELLSALVSRRDTEVVVSGIADILIYITDKFATYDEYCSNYPQALKLYKNIKNREEIRQYLEVSMNDPQYRGLSLESFLIKPVQRICKYPLLIRELIKNTPNDNPDKIMLESALSKMEEVVNLVNSKARHAEEQEKLAELQSRIDASPQLEFTGVLGRRLVKEGSMQRIINNRAKDRYLILLSDLIILCKTQMMSKGRYQFETIFELNNAHVSTTTICTPINAKMAKTVFEITFENGTEPVLFCATDEMERNRWAGAIQEVLKHKKTMIQNAAAKVLKPTSAPTNSRTSTIGSTSGIYATLKKTNTMSFRKGTQKSIWNRKPNTIDQESASMRSMDESNKLPANQHQDVDPNTLQNDCDLLVLTVKEFQANRPHQVSFPANVYLRAVNCSQTENWKIEMKGIIGWAPATHLQRVSVDTLGKKAYDELLQKVQTFPTQHVNMYTVPASVTMQSNGSGAELNLGTSVSLHKQLSTRLINSNTTAPDSQPSTQPNSAYQTQTFASESVVRHDSGFPVDVPSSDIKSNYSAASMSNAAQQAAPIIEPQKVVQAEAKPASEIAPTTIEKPEASIEASNVKSNTNQPSSGNPDPTTLSEVPDYPEWRSVQTDTGLTYYFNLTTGETSWQPPGFKPAIVTASNLAATSYLEADQSGALQEAHQQRAEYMNALKFHRRRISEHVTNKFGV